MDLRHLEYFYTVSQFKNFTHAAQHLHVSQPSVTNAINQLEDELGVKLLERNTKNVALTLHGEIFQKRVEGILSELKASIHEVKELNRKVKMGLPPMIGARIFPDVYTEFKKIFPAADFQVVEQGSLAAGQLLTQGELDLGFIILPEHTDALSTVPLIEEEIMVCLPPDHRLSGEKKIDFGQLKDEPFIILTDEFLHRKITLDLCTKHGFAPNIVFESQCIETAKSLVASGLGISLFMKLIVARNPDIVPVPLSQPIHIHIGLAWKKNRYISDHCRDFIQFAQSYFCGAPV